MLFLVLEMLSPIIIFLMMAYVIVYAMWYFFGVIVAGLTLALLIKGYIKLRNA